MAIEASDKLKEWVKNKKVLICASNGTDRTAWKKLCVDIGLPMHMIDTAEDFEASLDKIENAKPEIIFCSNEIKNGSGLDLMQKHKEVLVNRSATLFFLFSNHNSLALACTAAEEEIDALLIKPYNIKDLADNVIKAFEHKAALSNFEKSMYDIDELLHDEKFEEASELIEKGKTDKPKNAFPVFFEGFINEHSKKFSKACENYDTAVSLDPKHFRALRHGFSTDFREKRYKEAYDKLQKLLENFPLNPKRIPDYIRISIATQNFDNIMDFCEKFSEISDELGEDVEVPIAAGLVMSAKFLAQHDRKDQAATAAIRAMHFANGKANILGGALRIFEEIDDRAQGLEVYATLPDDIKSLPHLLDIVNDLKSGN